MRGNPSMGGLLRIRCDLRNLQTVHAWLEDGTYFGELYALGQWGKVPNDIRMRKMFGFYKQKAALSERADDNPMQALFEHLKNGAPTNQTMALQLAYVTHYLSQHVDAAVLVEWGGMVPIGSKSPAANEARTAPPASAPAPADSTGQPASAQVDQALAATAPAVESSVRPASQPPAPAPPPPPKLVVDNAPRVRMAVPRRLRR
jgi:hypothetical protein